MSGFLLREYNTAYAATQSEQCNFLHNQKRISAMGEALDVGDMKPSKRLTSREADYREHVKRHLQNLETLMRQCADIINSFSSTRIDPVAFADALWESIEEALQGIDFNAAYNGFIKKDSKDTKEFVEEIRYGIRALFTSGVTIGENQAWIDKYEERMRAHAEAMK